MLADLLRQVEDLLEIFEEVAGVKDWNREELRAQGHGERLPRPERADAATHDTNGRMALIIGHLRIQMRSRRNPGQLKVAREIDLVAVALTDGDRRQDVEIAIEDSARRGRHARAGGLPILIAETRRRQPGRRAELRQA